MSRPTPVPRNLSATEELEKLEQSITLTLQEIDQNFSKAHRIVTTSILPLVEQYGDHSRSVWEASKFWKQFFEASANVSLSGYEELNKDETTIEESTAQEETSIDASSQHDVTASTDSPDHSTYPDEESLLDDAELSGSTPRPPSTKTVRTQFASLESPYQTMQREMRGEEEEEPTEVLESDGEDTLDNSTLLFQQRTARLPEMSLTPRGALHGKDSDQARDPLLHRMLDKTYRIKSTPHKNVPPLSAQKHAAPAAAWDSPMSSPEMAVPKLRSEAFMSPLKSMAARQRLQAPRTPGVSVQTPTGKRPSRDVFGTREGDTMDKAPKYEIDWESDSDDGVGGMSPPKTIQFALPPSKMLQTPAREASKRIVNDILLTAGAAPEEETEEYSPSIVRMSKDILDDTF